MTRSLHAALLALTLAAPPALRAQATPPEVTVRTFTLRHLEPRDAARLLAPYVVSQRGGVFEAGAGARAVTVRETPETLARIESVLREYDRPPATLVLRFQLIAADDSPTRDPAIAGVDSALRGLFRFAGYRLLSQGVATVGEQQSFMLTMGAGDDRLRLSGEVRAIDATQERGSVHVRVGLERPGAGNTASGAPVAGEGLLHTGLTVPLGQTVVLGSAVPGGRVQALILTVRPELAPRRE